MRLCRNGHEYTPENTYRDSRGPQCRACRKIARQKRSHADRAANPDELTPAQLRRLRDALADGVHIADLAERFGICRQVISRMKEEAA